MDVGLKTLAGFGAAFTAAVSNIYALIALTLIMLFLATPAIVRSVSELILARGKAKVDLLLAEQKVVQLSTKMDQKEDA